MYSSGYLGLTLADYTGLSLVNIYRGYREMVPMARRQPFHTRASKLSFLDVQDLFSAQR
jgi:hypothetical protein